MRTKFVQAEVFPFVADAIGRVYGRTHDFVTHRQIVSAMLDDDTFVRRMRAGARDEVVLGRRVSNVVAWFSQRITVGRSPYQAYFVHRERKGGRWAYKPPTAELPLGDDPDGAVAEGHPNLVFHLRRERDRALVRRKKEDVIKRHGALACEACGFDFAREYPGLGEDFCEVHHVKPLADLSGPRLNSLEDLVVLCSNCHRMIHRTNPIASLAEFRSRFKRLRALG